MPRVSSDGLDRTDMLNFVSKLNSFVSGPYPLIFPKLVECTDYTQRARDPSLTEYLRSNCTGQTQASSFVTGSSVGRQVRVFCFAWGGCGTCALQFVVMSSNADSHLTSVITRLLWLALGKAKREIGGILIHVVRWSI